MEKDTRITLRISTRERAKINECSDMMGCSAGEFLRRCMQVMLMVMGDKESEKAIRQILKEATGTMKMGAGLATRTPHASGVTGTHLSGKSSTRKRKSGK